MIKYKYLQDRKARLDEKLVNDYAIFGQLGGIIIFILSFAKWLTTYGEITSKILVALMIFGVYMISSGVIIPQSLNWCYKIFSVIGNKIGEIIFKILLFIVYIIFVLPAGYFMRNKKYDYLYLSWNDKYPFEEKNGFTQWHSSGNLSGNGFLSTSGKLLGLFIANGKYIFIPAVLILIALGIILFFVSSSVMAPFIYTLF